MMSSWTEGPRISLYQSSLIKITERASMNLGERIIYITSFKDYNLGSINYIPVDNAFVENYIHSVVIETGGWIHGGVFVGERFSKALFLRFMNILLYFGSSLTQVGNAS